MFESYILHQKPAAYTQLIQSVGRKVSQEDQQNEELDTMLEFEL
jgi:hypothetical protein